MLYKQKGIGTYLEKKETNPKKELVMKIKKIIALTAIIVGCQYSTIANANEFKPFMTFATEFVYGDSGRNNPELDNFNATHRIRFGFDYITDKNLSATMMLQYGHLTWGNYNNGFDADPSVIGTGFKPDHFRFRLGYIDWKIPQTEIGVRMGRQWLVAPSYAFCNTILDGRGDAITFYGDLTDNINLKFSLFKVRHDNIEELPRENEANALLLMSEINDDNFKLAPWMMYVSKQRNSGYQASITASKVPVPNLDGYGAEFYLLGLSGQFLYFDPFVISFDALYSKTQTANVNVDENSYYGALNFSYKLDNGTLALKGWYASGSDLRNGKNKQKLFPLLDGGFHASSVFFGDIPWGIDGYANLNGDTALGTQGAVLAYENFSIVDKLTHIARIIYIQGTNQIDNQDFFDPKFLTDNDKLWEVNLNSTYEIYNNFTATLALGYLFVDQTELTPGTREADNVFRSALTFLYSF